MPTFSTQSSIEARISAARLNTLADFDGDESPDTATINAAIAFAGSYVAGRVEPRYGSDNIALWDLDQGGTPHDLIAKISDDLAIWQLAVAKPHLYADVNIDVIKDTADEMLDKLAEHEMSLYGVDAPVDDEFITERTKSDFDPERDVDNISVRPTWIRSDPRELPDYPE